MARTRRRLKPAEAPQPVPVEPGALLGKARAVAARMRALKGGFDGAHRLAHEAQVREALTRSELTEALNASLVARAALEARLRDQALAAYRAGRPQSGRLRRNNRLNQALDRVLAGLGPAGEAIVVARSGVRGGPGPLLFDAAWYLAANPDVAAVGRAPLVHYLLRGAREGRAPHPLLAAEWYGGRHAAELAASSVTPLEHFVRVGAARGDGPHPAFDVAHYLAQAPALSPGEDPVSHYLREGARLGLSPHPLFDPAWYAGQAGGEAGEGGLVHYLTEGWRRGRSPHPLFDPRWYRRTYPHAADSGLEPLTHFLSRGGAEGLSPGPWFDLPAYVAQRGAALAAGVNPLVDYLRGGAWTVAEPRPGFPTAAYLASEPDLAGSGLTPLEHWARRAGR